MMGGFDRAITVVHDGDDVPVHPATAWAYDLRVGEAVTDSDLRRLMRCTQFVGAIERRFAGIVAEACAVAAFRREGRA